MQCTLCDAACENAVHVCTLALACYTLYVPSTPQIQSPNGPRVTLLGTGLKASQKVFTFQYAQ